MKLFWWKTKFERLAQLDDYSGEIILEIYDMTDSRDIYRAKKDGSWSILKGTGCKKARRKQRKGKKLTVQATLDKFIGMPLTPKEIFKAQSFRAPYHRKPRVVSKEEFVGDKIPDMYYNYFKTFKETRGTINDMMILNDFSIFDAYQEDLKKIQRACGRYLLKDMVKLYLFHKKMGFKTHEQFYRVIQFMPFLPKELALEGIEILADLPDISTFQRILRVAGAKPVLAFFRQLVAECFNYNLVDFKVLMVDGRFFHANSNNNKPEGSKTYSDPDAGYRRHCGRKLGVGYTEDCISAHQGKYVLPVHFQLYSGNTNEKKMNPKTFYTLPEIMKDACVLFLGDKGRYSLDTCKMIYKKGIVPVIDVPSNVTKHNTVETPGGHRFNIDFIPQGWILDLDRIYALRALHEAGFSANSLVHAAKRTSWHGLEMAYAFTGLLKSLDLLTALTAFKTGRLDLIWTSTAFTGTRFMPNTVNWMNIASTSGFTLLDR